MSNPRDRFLAQFDPPVQRHIVEFGKRLSHTPADVFVTMARKATCFVECLERLSLTALTAPTTTDRVLDACREWLRG